MLIKKLRSLMNNFERSIPGSSSKLPCSVSLAPGSGGFISTVPNIFTHCLRSLNRYNFGEQLFLEAQ